MGWVKATDRYKEDELYREVVNFLLDILKKTEIDKDGLESALELADILDEDYTEEEIISLKNESYNEE